MKSYRILKQVIHSGSYHVCFKKLKPFIVISLPYEAFMVYGHSVAGAMGVHVECSDEHIPGTMVRHILSRY
jgi:hypothetical protein